MIDLNPLAIVVAAVVAFLLSFGYYTAFGRQLAQLNEAYASTDQPPPWKLAVEAVRNLVLATVLAGFADQMGVDAFGEALLLGLVAWIGFPVVLWTGAVIWENVPRQLAAIHGGDWLLKLLVISAIVGVWQ